ncbi:UbiX family flavin prenyltransferase [Breoghania corrubedonensis]|uniref:UbiX family flavin prenyltransferase n=1 Tax=Breoghania corrubedonensis TaxID=665038 RepID=UPI001FEA5316|nr:UbiX family flavin prenyltransferase [Breoghania corrubedonensis]
MDRNRLIIGISGASGAIYGIRALELLKGVGDVETHLVLSPAASSTIEAETDFTGDEVAALADVVHDFRDVGASIASGSCRALGMLVAPCSIKTLSGVANSYCDSLMVRAADVCLKERRRLVLMVRETPLHAGHLDLMQRATGAGAVILPPVPAFYTKPQSLDDVVTHSVARALDLFDIEIDGVKRWKDG